MKAVLLSEDLSDMHFLVEIEDFKVLNCLVYAGRAHRGRLPAHKFVLTTASLVLRGQFSGHFDVPETIDVDDTTPEVSKTVLRKMDPRTEIPVGWKVEMELLCMRHL